MDLAASDSRGLRLDDALARAPDPAAPLPTRMRPLGFDGCFGWLHTAAGIETSDIAVVICPGLSRDALNGHRALRLFADSCAAHGYPALRFDYPGAGDSHDIDGVEPWAAWQRGIHAACELARAITGARRIVLCGLRLGALLAGHVASRRDDVAGLVLLAPVLRGKAYIRQLLVEARLRAFPPETPDGGLELDDLRLSAETVGLISRADMRTLKLPLDCRIAFYEQPRSTAMTDCLAAWAGQGLEDAYAIASDLSALVRPSYLNDESPADHGEVMAWLTASVPVGAAAAPPRATIAECQVARHLAGCVETPLRFGPRGHLFGMLCRPDSPVQTDFAVVIANTGGDPHFGFARFSVELARGLAAAGIASLRMDFAGLGDSRGTGGGCDDTGSHIFDTDRGADFSAAFDALEQLGYRRFALHGLCSGAYHAFHASLREPRVGALILVNMPVFSWQLGDSIEYVNRKASRTPIYYLANAIRREVWSRLLRGEIDMVGIVWAQYARCKERSGEFLRRAAARMGWRSPPSFPRSGVQTLSDRGTRTLFLLSKDDMGVAELEKYFGQGGAELNELPGIEARIEPGLDHMLTSGRMRRDALAIILRFLKNEPPPGPSRP